MNQVCNYLVPDYYPAFACKMGGCRSACCEGWPISFSLNDYFKLLSVECSSELRRTLDCALHIAEHPTPEAYAQISPRFDGQCPMRMADGRCALHAELGEGALSAVCRLYPRGVRTDGSRECSCANSCEAVIELLIDRDAPISFVNMPLYFDLPDAPVRRHFFETAGREQEIRLWLIGKIQDRKHALPQRILLLGEAMHRLESALSAHDLEWIDDLLTGREEICVLETGEADDGQLRFGLEAANAMLEILDERSDSIRAYGESALAYFGSGEEAFRRYMTAREHFETLMPGWELWFEHMLVNHMFFVQFPFQDRPVELKDEFLALCAVYALLRFLEIGWMAGRSGREEMVDVAAAAFRLIDHTEFDRFSAPILKKLGCGDRNHLARLLCL